MNQWTHKDVMSILKSVPGVKEHLNKPSVIEKKENAKQQIKEQPK